MKGLVADQQQLLGCQQLHTTTISQVRGRIYIFTKLKNGTGSLVQGSWRLNKCYCLPNKDILFVVSTGHQTCFPFLNLLPLCCVQVKHITSPLARPLNTVCGMSSTQTIAFTLCHSWLKVHGGVPIVLCVFWDPLVLRINCLGIRD